MARLAFSTSGGENLRVKTSFVALAAACVLPAAAQPRIEYRGFWVDTFNTALNNHADVLAVVSNAKAAGANVIFAQVRRRGDAWYLNSLEPPPDYVAIASGFDPLQDLITEAHAGGIEVHAFVIAAAIWNKNPGYPPSPTLGPPLDPNHVFNRHGGYDPVTNTIVPGPDNWLTRTLLADVSGAIGFQGHRFGSDFWLDFGHPDAAAYTVDVLMRLVRGYNLDGLHLDRIRYPDFSYTGLVQTPAAGVNIGYNPTSVARFQRHYGLAAGSPPPAPNDPLWSQWRRDQVTNLVRRVYLNAVAVRPDLKVSAALIAYGAGPVAETAWNSAEAYWRVFQDWRAWSEEGILDIAIPMNYKREHVTTEAAMFDQWNEWTKNHQYRRAAMIGLGVYLNSVEGTVRQTRRSLAASQLGRSAIGVNFYSMANTNAAVASNPWSLPVALANTPLRLFADFALGLTTGKTADGAIVDDNPAAGAVFAAPAVTPVLPWKVAPRNGHLMGFARGPDGQPLDTVLVTIQNLDTLAFQTAVTDGGGFYGAVDLPPGTYLVRTRIPAGRYSCAARVDAGHVTPANLLVPAHRPRRQRSQARMRAPVPCSSEQF